MPELSAAMATDQASASPSPVLHLLWSDPATDPLRQICLDTASEADCVVLMAEAALAAVSSQRWLAGRRGRWLVLLPDLVSLGFDQQQLDPAITGIDHGELVDLSCRYPLIQSWG